ncbi:MAG: hypothetical protein ACNYPI_05485 [Arenicellales bacterium WSBS_2016_MAG_OTU3]
MLFAVVRVVIANGSVVADGTLKVLASSKAENHNARPLTVQFGLQPQT